MSTPTPTPGTGPAQTPRRDAIRHNVIQIFKQWRDGHIYDSDVEGFLFGAFEDCSLIERDLTTAQHQLQEARELLETVAGGLSRLSIPADQFGDASMRAGMFKLITAFLTTTPPTNEGGKT